MKKDTMGSGAAMGVHNGDSKRVFAWFWRSWMEAQAEIPLLRWLGLVAVAVAVLVVVLAARQGKGFIDIAVDGATALLFILAMPVIFYLLFEIYRKHRTDAIFDSKRLADLIRRISQEEIAANESSAAGRNGLPGRGR